MISILFFCCLLHAANLYAQDGRLESEYKLYVPPSDVEDIWTYVQNSYGQQEFVINGQSLTGTQSVETFIDNYFDSDDRQLAVDEVSLRHRKRFTDGQLLKQLVQLKLPYSTDKVIRNEIKFDVAKLKNGDKLYAGHPLLKLLNNSDKERMQYHLASYQLRIEQLRPELKFRQHRRRVYISDDAGESVATITLDQVTHFSIPFLTFAELELELNEIKYTSANADERAYMEALNESMKTHLSEKFPDLKVDQRSKYNKMLILEDESSLSNLWHNSIWFFFVAVTFSALFLYIKDQFS